MQLILVQHGLALLESEDPNRPLSPEGRAEVEKVARHLGGVADELIPGRIGEVRHSGKLRAKQTAEILIQHAAPSAAIVSNVELRPGADGETLAVHMTARGDEPGTMMIVGHMPHLAKVAAHLLTGRETMRPIRFVNAGLVSFTWTEDDWGVDWILTPAMLP